MLDTHGERASGDQDEADADRGASRDIRMHREKASGEVSQVVGRSEPATLGHRDAVVGLHHRKDRCEGESADPHRYSECRKATDRHGEGRVRTRCGHF